MQGERKSGTTLKIHARQTGTKPLHKRIGNSRWVLRNQGKKKRKKRAAQHKIRLYGTGEGKRCRGEPA